MPENKYLKQIRDKISKEVSQNHNVNVGSLIKNVMDEGFKGYEQRIVDFNKDQADFTKEYEKQNKQYKGKFPKDVAEKLIAESKKIEKEQTDLSQLEQAKKFIKDNNIEKLSAKEVVKIIGDELIRKEKGKAGKGKDKAQLDHNPITEDLVKQTINIVSDNIGIGAEYSSSTHNNAKRVNQI